MTNNKSLHKDLNLYAKSQIISRIMRTPFLPQSGPGISPQDAGLHTPGLGSQSTACTIISATLETRELRLRQGSCTVTETAAECWGSAAAPPVESKYTAESWICVRSTEVKNLSQIHIWTRINTKI